jgi:hypothetical protein
MSFEDMFNAASTHSMSKDEKQIWAKFAVVSSKPYVFKNFTASITAFKVTE